MPPAPTPWTRKPGRRQARAVKHDAIRAAAARLFSRNGYHNVSLDDIAKVDLVIRDGRLQVQGGAVVTPRHEPVPPPPVNRAPGGDRRVP